MLRTHPLAAAQGAAPASWVSQLQPGSAFSPVQSFDSTNDVCAFVSPGASASTRYVPGGRRNRGRRRALGGAGLAVPFHGVGHLPVGRDAEEETAGARRAVAGGPDVVVAAGLSDRQDGVLRAEVDLAVAAGGVLGGELERGLLAGRVGVAHAAQRQLDGARGAVGETGSGRKLIGRPSGAVGAVVGPVPSLAPESPEPAVDPALEPSPEPSSDPSSEPLAARAGGRLVAPARVFADRGSGPGRPGSDRRPRGSSRWTRPPLLRAASAAGADDPHDQQRQQRDQDSRTALRRQ